MPRTHLAQRETDRQTDTHTHTHTQSLDGERGTEKRNTFWLVQNLWTFTFLTEHKYLHKFVFERTLLKTLEKFSWYFEIYICLLRESSFHHKLPKSQPKFSSCKIKICGRKIWKLSLEIWTSEETIFSWNLSEGKCCTDVLLVGSRHFFWNNILFSQKYSTAVFSEDSQKNCGCFVLKIVCRVNSNHDVVGDCYFLTSERIQTRSKQHDKTHRYVQDLGLPLKLLHSSLIIALP